MALMQEIEDMAKTSKKGPKKAPDLLTFPAI